MPVNGNRWIFITIYWLLELVDIQELIQAIFLFLILEHNIARLNIKFLSQNNDDDYQVQSYPYLFVC